MQAQLLRILARGAPGEEIKRRRSIGRGYIFKEALQNIYIAMLQPACAQIVKREEAARGIGANAYSRKALTKVGGNYAIKLKIFLVTARPAGGLVNTAHNFNIFDTKLQPSAPALVIVSDDALTNSRVFFVVARGFDKGSWLIGVGCFAKAEKDVRSGALDCGQIFVCRSKIVGSLKALVKVKIRKEAMNINKSARAVRRLNTVCANEGDRQRLVFIGKINAHFNAKEGA